MQHRQCHQDLVSGFATTNMSLRKEIVIITFSCQHTKQVLLDMDNYHTGTV